MKNYIEISEKIEPYKKTICISGDKSISIRTVLLASQAIGKSKIYNLLEAEDVINALKCIGKLGIKYKKKRKYFEINGCGLNGYKIKGKKDLYAGNSGTLARLILGLLININKEIKILGDKSLSKRDFSRVTDPLRLFGAVITANNKKLPVKIFGSSFLRPVKYKENLGSAQCKSAVMLASLKAPGVTRIKAKKSRDHTELMFKSLKIPIKIKKTKTHDFIEIEGLNNFRGFNYIVPGDISSSSFFIVLTLLANKSKLIIKNINVNKTRTGIVEILKKMGANISFKNKRLYKGEATADIFVESCSDIKSINCPESLNSSAIDEFLVIFLVAAKAKGVSTFRNLGELNKKESPRLDIAVKILKKIGIKVLRNKDNIKILGQPNLILKKKIIIKDFKKDHRVFMMSCVAALAFGGKWKINNSDSVKTSFPDFFKVIKSVGAKIN